MPLSGRSPAQIAGNFNMPSDAEKHCPLCDESWPADTEFFYPDIAKKDGLCFCCRACYKERYRPTGSRRKLPQQQTEALSPKTLDQVWSPQ